MRVGEPHQGLRPHQGFWPYWGFWKEAHMYVKVLMAVVVLAACMGCALFEGGVTGGPEPSSNAGYLELTVNVRNAEVYTGGELRGMIKKADRPQSILIPAGAHELTVKKFGYHPYKARIAIEAGAVNTLVIELKRLPTEVVELPPDKPSEKK